jgi:hypothetical protein
MGTYDQQGIEQMRIPSDYDILVAGIKPPWIPGKTFHFDSPKMKLDFIVKETGVNKHPLDDPKFRATSPEPVFYLAHPLAPDDKYTFQQNMDHSVRMIRLCFDEGFRVVAPWHTICMALDDTNSEHRRIGLEVDCAIVHKLQRIILCGHKISRGMGLELSMIVSITSRNTINLVGMDDETARCYLRAHKFTASDSGDGRNPDPVVIPEFPPGLYDFPPAP